MDIVIQRHPRDDGVALAVSGRLDAESSDELRHAVAAEIRRGLPAITLDLSAVSFLSSAGISALFEAQRDARGAGGECLITTASEPVRKVLQLTRLDRVLMQSADLVAATPPPTPTARRDVEVGGVRLVDLGNPPPRPLACRLHGATAVLSTPSSIRHRLRVPAGTFAIGIGGVADADALGSAGEMVAAGGTVYHRGPRPFAAVDYLAGGGDLVAEADILTGLSWDGSPGGHAGFEPVDEENRNAVGLDDLAAAILSTSDADTLAIVVAAEIHGLVGAELIRPLSEASADDHPLVGLREVVARWLCFSREPVHAGRTALVVGVIGRAAAVRGHVAESLAPLGSSDIVGHCHAVVFPHRPIRRAAGNLPALLTDLSASEPIAVMHLVTDERPVLGRGTSGFVRGACWFAPIAFGEVGT